MMEIPELAQIETPYRRLFIGVVVQAIKDFALDPSEKGEVINWVEKRDGSFSLCAASMGLNTNALYELFKEKMKRIRNGESVYITGGRFLTHRQYKEKK